MENYKDATPTALIPLDRIVFEAQSLLDEIHQTTN
jgi:hypothetical protein